MDVDLIYDSKVIERYYSRHFGKRGSLIYYPSDFANKVYNLKSKKKNKFPKSILMKIIVP